MIRYEASFMGKAAGVAFYENTWEIEVHQLRNLKALCLVEE
jgi:hypothetical protein